MFGFKRSIKKEEFTLNWRDKKIKVAIHFEKRTNSRVSLTKTGIHIRLPLALTKVEGEYQISKFIDWAKERLDERPEQIVPAHRIFRDQELLQIYDRTYLLSIQEGKSANKSFVAAKENQIVFKIQQGLNKEDFEKTVANLLAKQLAKMYKLKIWEQLINLNNIHHFGKVNRLSMKNNSSNWGSCSSKGNINISVRLLLAPPSVVSYVLIHELSHLQEQNHSAKYWKIVERACPNYQESERWLKKNAKYCII